jgi:hypothetical protein
MVASRQASPLLGRRFRPMGSGLFFLSCSPGAPLFLPKANTPPPLKMFHKGQGDWVFSSTGVSHPWRRKAGAVTQRSPRRPFQGRSMAFPRQVACQFPYPQ